MNLPDKAKIKKTTDGKAVITHVDDAGKEYVARTCEGPEVTPADVDEMMTLGDRERSAGFGQDALKRIEDNKKAFEDQMDADFAEPAERVAHAGLHREGLSVGYSRRYSENFEQVFGTTEATNE